MDAPQSSHVLDTLGKDGHAATCIAASPRAQGVFLTVSSLLAQDTQGRTRMTQNILKCPAAHPRPGLSSTCPVTYCFESALTS